MSVMPQVPQGMSRRHFMSHLAGASSMVIPALTLGHSLRTHAADLKKRRKSAILLWMSGGPSTMDIWDLKPGAVTGGPFRPIRTAGDVEISEHMPETAKIMNHLSIVRSMSTREADHNRGRYYMHTGFKPDPNIEYPGYGAVVAHELHEQSKYMNLEIPPVFSITGPSAGPGFLSMAYSPFVVDSGGNIRNLQIDGDAGRLAQRMSMLSKLEKGFAEQGRGQMAYDHAEVLKSTAALMTSKQMEALKVDQESDKVKELYGLNQQPAAPGAGMGMRQNTGFLRSCLMARRLIESGVRFVTITDGGWDTHQNNFTSLKTRLMPPVDQALPTLFADLEARGMLESTMVIWLTDFGRTPKINSASGRDHWASAAFAVAAGEARTEP
mgnify:CR=1 FL=1